MKRTCVFLYGVISYAIFLAVFLYSIGFVGDFVVPKSVDNGTKTQAATAVLINAVLLGLFAVQHTVMARKSFKQCLTRLLPRAAERSTYVMISSLLLALVFWQWRPLPAVVWEVNHPLGAGLLWLVFAAGWGLVLLSSFLTSHTDLFGLRQVYHYWLNKDYHPIPLKSPLLYNWVRHPLLLGFIIAFWAIPAMTAGHLLFAAITTGYMLIGIQFEERDLIRIYGEHYEIYRKTTPMLIPRIWRIFSQQADSAEKGKEQ